MRPRGPCIAVLVLVSTLAGYLLGSDAALHDEASAEESPTRSPQTGPGIPDPFSEFTKSGEMPTSLAIPAIAGPGDVVIEEKSFDIGGGATLRVDHGTLEVPANRRDPDTGTIKLAFARVHSTAEEPASPVIYLAGGPGGSSTWQAESPQFLSNWLGILEVSDVILLDQRGTGRSEPSNSPLSTRQPKGPLKPRPN